VSLAAALESNRSFPCWLGSTTWQPQKTKDDTLDTLNFMDPQQNCLLHTLQPATARDALFGSVITGRLPCCNAQFGGPIRPYRVSNCQTCCLSKFMPSTNFAPL